MKTKMHILRPGADASEEREVYIEERPGYPVFRDLINPILEGGLEHVTVLHNGGRRDMFVNEFGAINGSPRNEAATAIYRNATLTREPSTDPESIPAIYGIVVLFPDRQVWF